MKLHTLPTTKTATKKRVGRGDGSCGTYSGRGIKGQKARSGGKGGLKIKGAKQTILRLPKTRGFKSPHAKMAVVNVKDLGVFTEKDLVDPKALVDKGLIPSARFGVKILGEGALKAKLTVKAHAFSASAKKAIETAGGKAEVLESKRSREIEAKKKPQKPEEAKAAGQKEEKAAKQAAKKPAKKTTK